MGIEIIGSSGDGDEAFETICELTPDLVITDIKMPTLNGIELIKLLHRANIYPKVIFATGHSDFEYTREAIRLGAYDYLLKPFSPNELITTVVNCVNDINASNTKMYNEERRQCEILFKNYFSTSSNQAHLAQSNALTVILNETFQITDMAINSLNTLLTPETSPTNVNLDECIDTIRRLNFKLGWEQYFIFALSEPQSIIIINYRNATNSKNTDFVTTNKNYIATIQESLFVNLAVESTINCNVPIAFTNKGQASLDVLYQQYSDYRFHSTEATNEWLVMDTIESQKYVQDAINFIHRNYGKSLKLQEVADCVFLSESHFSALFTKYVGVSFSKYLAKYRIEMAKNYMKNNPYAKIYEVSNQVGYTDARYFSTLFKKTEGITPSAYVKHLF